MGIDVKGKTMKKIYLASSWKNAGMLHLLADALRRKGFKVDLFCDKSTGRFVFNWQETPDFNYKSNEREALKHKYFQKAFKEDKKMIEWCDICIMVLPCGKSSHLEAGYAKGIGKKLYIFGEFVRGQFDVMYGFADGLFSPGELSEMIDTLNR